MSRRRYLVAYDIREDRRLRRTHLTMKSFGYPLQYSLFVCDLDAIEKLAMRAAVGDEIKHSEDSVAIIDLGEAETRGAQCFEFMGALAYPFPESGSVIL